MALWKDVALRDMRIPGSTASYRSTYAANDDTLLGRRITSSLATKATLTMGRYASPEAFTTTNPDYSAELSYFPSTDPIRTTAWTRINQWDHIALGVTSGVAGRANFENTRVMVWDHEVWVKSKSSGLWTRRINQQTGIGEWWTASFDQYGGAYDAFGDAYRIEAETGYPSIKPPIVAGVTGGYFLWHGYTSLVAIDGPDVADVISFAKCSLVLDDPTQPDDRDASRYLYAMGSDYYPASKLSSYPGVGISRHRFVRAKWPEWEFRVMHTMTEAQFNATNGFPSELALLTESGGSSGGGGGGGSQPPPPSPASRARWFPALTGGRLSWEPMAVTNTAPNKVRRGRRPRLG